MTRKANKIDLAMLVILTNLPFDYELLLPTIHLTVNLMEFRPSNEPISQ
jgi:hypothetical protein